MGPCRVFGNGRSITLRVRSRFARTIPESGWGLYAWVHLFPVFIWPLYCPRRPGTAEKKNPVCAQANSAVLCKNESIKDFTRGPCLLKIYCQSSSMAFKVRRPHAHDCQGLSKTLSRCEYRNRVAPGWLAGPEVSTACCLCVEGFKLSTTNTLPFTNNPRASVLRPPPPAHKEPALPHPYG